MGDGEWWRVEMGDGGIGGWGVFPFGLHCAAVSAVVASLAGMEMLCPSIALL